MTREKWSGFSCWACDRQGARVPLVPVDLPVRRGVVPLCPLCRPLTSETLSARLCAVPEALWRWLDRFTA